MTINKKCNTYEYVMFYVCQTHANNFGVFYRRVLARKLAGHNSRTYELQADEMQSIKDIIVSYVSEKPYSFNTAVIEEPMG